MVVRPLEVKMHANLCLSNIIVIVANVNSRNGLCLKLNQIYWNSAVARRHTVYAGMLRNNRRKMNVCLRQMRNDESHYINGACFILPTEAANYGQNLLLINFVAFDRRATHE